jgi:hypothetical protein
VSWATKLDVRAFAQHFLNVPLGTLVVVELSAAMPTIDLTYVMSKS